MSDANAETPQQAFKNLADQKMKVDTTEPETSLWQGGFSPKAMVGTWLFSFIMTVIIAVACVALQRIPNINMSSGTISLIGGVIVLAWWGLAVCQYIYKRLSVHYELTSQRFIHKHGILTRTTDRIDVIDIDDVTFKQGIVERMLGVGTIKLTGSDRTHPEFYLIGIDQVDKISELFDNTRRKERRRRSLHIESV